MKKGLRIFCALFLFFSVKSFSQTVVSGTITQNTTWTKVGSPYTLSGTVKLSTGITLTIEPGVVVRRPSKSELLVGGAIVAMGTATDSIYFQTTDVSAASTPPFLEFEGTSLSQSAIRFLSCKSLNTSSKIIRIGSDNEQTAPTKNSGTLSVSRSNLSDGNVVSHGYNSGISMNLDSCFFDSADIHCLDAFSEKINITNSTLLNSTQEADDDSYGILDSNCAITNTSFVSGVGTAIVTIKASSLTSSTLGVPNSARLTIDHSTLNDSPINGNPGSVVNVNASQFFTNNPIISQYPKIGVIHYLITADQANITNSQLNGQSNIDALAIYGNGNDTTNEIAHNTFNTFTDGVTVYDFQDGMHIDSNTFQSVGTYDIINYSPLNFNAVYDYYSLTGAQTPADVIYDKQDDASYGQVNYIPYANASALPVSLVSFTGVYRNGSIVLNWQTANEVNMQQYVVQRAVNGSYEDVATLAAKGAGSNLYTYTPASLSSGQNAYRLKMVDRDGTYRYSSIVSVNVPGSSLAFTVYPNPATRFVVVSHAAAETASQLQLTDRSGRVLATVVVAKGDIQNTLYLGTIAKGTYQLVWRNGNSMESKAILVQ